MAANAWATVPGNTLASINPENSLSSNANYPAAARYHAVTGHTAVLDKWNGFAWDDATATAHFPLQGGHTDWAGNETYKNCLNVDTPAFLMTRKPSGWDNSIILNDSQENTGLYADGRLRPGHTYNNNIYVPGLGPVVCRVKGPYVTGNSDIGRVYVVGETTGEATLLSDITGVTNSQSYGGACYDTLRNCIYTFGNGNTPLVKIDIATGTPSVVISSDNYVAGYAKLEYLAAYDLIAVFQNGGSGYPQPFYLIDPSNGFTRINPTITGSFSSGFIIAGYQGTGWDNVSRKFYLWGNAVSRNEISVLVPSGNPRTQPWVASVIAGSGITPTMPSSNGTFSKFGYSSKLGGCYLLNATTEQFQFFATE